jgi:MFS transporter, putative metabolite:H+ symporter
MTAYIAVGLIKGMILQPTTPDFFDLNSIASLVSAGFAGMFLGTFVFTRICDHFGRVIRA